MKKLILCSFLLISFFQMTAQSSDVWRKNRIFVEKVDSLYYFEIFVYRYEINYDTLYKINDNRYLGKYNGLIILNENLYITTEKFKWRIKLYKANDDDIKWRDYKRKFCEPRMRYLDSVKMANQYH